MVRIIIEIDGAEAAVTTLQPAALTAAFPKGAVTSTIARLAAPPPEVAAAAAALGATSAGPAPSGALVPAPDQTSPLADTAPEAISAGPAPTSA